MSESNEAFISAAAKLLLERRKLIKERDSKRAAKLAAVKREQEMPIEELRESVANTAMSFREAAQAADVAKRMNMELAAIHKRDVLLHMLHAERVKQRVRMKQQGLKPPRKQHRDRNITGEMILKRKFGPLTPQFQFHYDAEIDSPILSQQDGKYRCKCDCGRIVYKHKHHLLRTIDEPGRAIRTCGKECGLNRTAKPVDGLPPNNCDGLPHSLNRPPNNYVDSDAQSAHCDAHSGMSTPTIESSNVMKAAFAQFGSRISGSGDAEPEHIKGTSARGKD